MFSLVELDGKFEVWEKYGFVEGLEKIYGCGKNWLEGFKIL